MELDIPVDLIRKGLVAFSGVERRFHLRGEKAGIMVVDDYGHHPDRSAGHNCGCEVGAGTGAWSCSFNLTRYSAHAI